MTDVAPPTSTGRHRVFADDFRDGFATAGAGARWFHTTAGPYVADDGVVTTSADGLRVVSSAVHLATGEPAFASTVAQETANGLGLPGVLDHTKWLVFANHRATSGVSGFDAPAGRVLTGSARVRGRTYGTGGHPFGAAVRYPEDDLRLAAVTVNAFDPETYIVFDVFLTNRRVYAFYERLPFARPQLGHYAAFSYGIPVADRSPGDEHDVAITYDADTGTVGWLLDGAEVFRIDRIGCHLPGRRHLVLDHGGAETVVAPRQLNFGMGLLTLLDGALPGHPGTGLVRLSEAEDFYFDPVAGAPTPQRFVDETSRPESRLFGQGAELRVRRFAVDSRPVS